MAKGSHQPVSDKVTPCTGIKCFQMHKHYVAETWGVISFYIASIPLLQANSSYFCVTATAAACVCTTWNLDSVDALQVSQCHTRLAVDISEFICSIRQLYNNNLDGVH